MLIAVITGCSSPELVESEPLVLPMQIVVSDGGVSVYLDGADFSGCGCFPLRFPAPNECSFLSDVNTCNLTTYCQSCITDLHVEVDGIALEPTWLGGHDPWGRGYESFPPGELMLVIAGCGHDATRIPLDGAPFGEVTAVADYVDGVAHVAWTTNVPAPTTLLTMYGGWHGEVCRVDGASEYSFETWPAANYVITQPAAAITELDTELGPVTLWRVGMTTADFPPSP